MSKQGYIYGINGPVVTVKGSDELTMMEMVKVGNLKLIGEVIGIEDDRTIVQVYEDTTGLKSNEPVEGTGSPMCVTLGPGIIGSTYDGIQRPLFSLERETGAFIGRGIDVSPLNLQKNGMLIYVLKRATF